MPDNAVQPTRQDDGYEEFARKMRLFEDGPTTTNYQQLMEKGVELPDPESISDDDLRTKLWEVLSGLAELRVYLGDTDGLSDRELYAKLYHDVLRIEVPAIDDIGRCEHRQHPDNARSLLDTIWRYVDRRFTRGAGSSS